MKKLFLLTFITFSLLAKADDYKESPLFTAAGLVGFNTSQIYGDNLAGWNKFGFNFGAKAYVNFHKNWSTGFEFAFSQRGSRTNAGVPPENKYKLRLDYLDIPFFITYKDRRRAEFGAGLVLGRFINQKEVSSGIDITPSEPLVNTYSLEYILDVVFYGKGDFGFNFRYQGSIIPIAHWPGSILPNNAVQSVNMTFRVLYHFNR